jgi:dTDP-4-dehydrorhamnose reductase
MNKILITGCNGQVGWELQRTLASLGKIFAFDRQTLNLADANAIRHVVQTLRPTLIVNAAAFTAVDRAETEKESSYALNTEAPRVLAEEAKALNALLIHYSTDYVFDGTSPHPYTENDLPNPINAYGQSKLDGERAIRDVKGPHLIFRTSWVYASRGKNFLLTMLKLAKEKESLKIVNDQRGAPTWSRLIAEATSQILVTCLKHPQDHRWGIYNLTCAGQTTWFNFAESIFQLYSKTNPDFRTPKLSPISSSEYPTPAQRPKNSLLSSDKLHHSFGITLPDWQKALQFCLEELNHR